MTKNSEVVLVSCATYDEQTVQEAVQKGLTLLGGAGQFVQPGEKILIKPNLLVGDSPEKCISPHPSVFRAVLQAFQEAGAALTYGDSPGFGSTKAAARSAGLLSVAEELQVPMADFQNGDQISFPEGNLIKQFQIARGVSEADGMISLSKLKSHALTRITGSIKNQFGCIPGVLKAEFHSKLPSANQFSKMLVDLNLYLKPRLYIMDGIIAMEGNGPRSGNPRPMQVLLFSRDPVALDAAVCRMIHLDESLVDTLVYGNAYGLGSSREITFLGEALQRFDTPDFAVNRSAASTTTELGMLTSRFMRNHITPRPVIHEEQCTRCGRCVEVCPAEPKALSWKNGKKQPPVYDYNRCIRCYCCQELCPHEAISVVTPLLGRLIHH